MNDIRILATGGTFDKRYQRTSGLLGFEHSVIDQLLAQAGAQIPVDTLMLIDSLEMNDTHRQQIVTACEQAEERAVVIVHGTDTMVETAARLAAAALNKTIVLTGAMVPWSVRDSDAAFNLGFALAAARLLSGGVSIAMNGQIFAWDRVRKDRAHARFVSDPEPEH